jgi:iron complex outermembrane receptor protein
MIDRHRRRGLKSRVVDFLTPRLVIVNLVVAIVSSAWAMTATAQTAPPAETTSTPVVEEIVVTGSRIKAPNEVSTSPIQVVSAQEIERTGLTDVSDILYQLPQLQNNAVGGDFSNRTSGLTTPGGVTTADLRGLGPNRTLVLIDGKRLGQGTPQTTITEPAPDLDQIPLSLVDHVEVLTGGASSVYGSDAIAGVVNFIMKKNFQGLQVSGQWGEDEHGQGSSYVDPLLRQFGITPLTGHIEDGRSKNFSALFGTNFSEEKGNITGFLSYLHTDPVFSSDRDFAQCQLNELTDAGNVTGSACSGSSNSNRFTPLSGPFANTRFGVLGNSFVPWSPTDGTTPPPLFNSQPFISMQREDDRYQAGFLAHLDLQDYVRPYFEFNFMNDKTHTAVAPAAAFTTENPNTGGPYFVNCGNPFLSAQQQGVLGCTAAQISAPNQADPANQVAVTIGRRNVEGGARTFDFEDTNYRAAIGVKGDFLTAWSYDAYAQYYYVNFIESNNGYFSYANIDNALLVTGTRANPTCVVGSPCVPWNIFQDGGVTQNALKYLYLLGTETGDNTLRTLHADITGELGKYGIALPTAHEGIGVNFGFEHRNEGVFFQPDAAENSGQLSGQGGTIEPLNNSIGVNEGFIEMRAPLVQDQPFAKDLILGAGFRHSDYSTVGGVNTYKVDLQFAPIQDIRFRGSYQRAIRAPSVSEVYDALDLGQIAFGNDPCAAPATATLAQCLNSLKSLNPTAAQIAAFTKAFGNGTTTDVIPQGVSGQLTQVQGGSTALKPETAKSWTFGVLFAPGAMPNLTGSVDFWQIKVDDEVGVYPANVLVNNCLQTGNPVYCSQVVRTTTNFSLQGATLATGGYIIQTNKNLASALVSGIDVQTNYRLNLGSQWGSLLWVLNGSYIIHNSTTPLPGGGSYDCAGLFGSTCQTFTPRWRHNLSTTWVSPWALDASLNWRFIGKAGNDNNDPNPALHFGVEGGYDFPSAQVPNVSYIDLQLTWHTPLKGLDIRAGVNNLFDRDPPIVVLPAYYGAGYANSAPAYDTLGRQLYAAFTAKF